MTKEVPIAVFILQPSLELALGSGRAKGSSGFFGALSTSSRRLEARPSFLLLEESNTSGRFGLLPKIKETVQRSDGCFCGQNRGHSRCSEGKDEERPIGRHDLLSKKSET